MISKLLGEGTMENLLEITFMLVLLYLVVANSRGFSGVMGSLGDVYTSSVKVLQGR